MKRFILLAALSLLVSGPVLAKLKVGLIVRVKNDEDITAEVNRVLQARINSTERYTVVSNMSEADFLLGVNCIMLVENGHKTGVVCNSDVSFFPFENSGLYMNLELARGMVVSPLQNPSYIAEFLIDAFINGTTDEALETSRSLLRKSVRSYCLSQPKDCAAPQK